MGESIKYEPYETKSLLGFSKHDEYRMEQLFGLYKDPNTKHFFYNICNTLKFADDLSSDLYTVYFTQPQETWTSISFKHYNRIDLWWIIACLNNIDNTFQPIEPGLKLMIPHPSTVRLILAEIKNKTT